MARTPADRLRTLLNPVIDVEHKHIDRALEQLPADTVAALVAMVERADEQSDPVCSLCLGAPTTLTLRGRDHASGAWVFICADCDEDDW
ncbi:hypothetical protein [Phytoactinopolyspora endophytica]|uniref:hypothetical protein n=1 Tax=Phytoactinopolyspora endophytica TaxID=1642495 RepID=UPI00101C6108|nr:hypothetical protein [Phytoactinopolyspora endophytica]